MQRIIHVSELLGKNFGTRRSALAFRAYLMDSRFPLLLDFEGVENMTFAFASSVFGGLISTWGIEAFAKKVAFSNIDDRHRQMIDLIVAESVHPEKGT